MTSALEAGVRQNTHQAVHGDAQLTPGVGSDKVEDGAGCEDSSSGGDFTADDQDVTAQDAESCRHARQTVDPGQIFGAGLKDVAHVNLQRAPSGWC